MEHNNNGIVKQQIIECKEFVEKTFTKQADNCTYNQQSLEEFGSYIQDDNAILQSVRCISQIQPATFCTSLVSNHSNQEYATSKQNLNAQQTKCELNCVTTQTNIKIEPVASPRLISPQRIVSTPSSPHSQVTTADTQENEIKNVPKLNVTACTENLKPIRLTKSSPSKFRAVEFVLNNLDSAPGEEKFYSWSDKAKDFANTQLSKEPHEGLEITNSNNSQSTSVVMADLSRDKPSKRKSARPSSRSKLLKNANLAAERDRTLKKYANNLMRKKPKSWQPQNRITDEELS